MGRPRYRPGHWQDVSYHLRRMTHWETKCSFITQPESFASNQVHHPLCVTLLAFTIMLWTFRRKKRKESSFSNNSKPHLYSRPEGTGVVNEFMSTFHNFPSIILAFGLVLLIPCGTLQPPITKHPEATCTLDEYSTGHISILPNYIAGVIEVLSDCHMGTLEYISVRGLACCSVQLTLMLILLCGDVEVNPGPYEQDKKAELKGDSFGGDTERATTGPPTERPAEPIAVSSPSATSSASAVPLTLGTITLHKWTDENGQPKILRILDEISSRWTQVGDLLGLSPARLQGIEKHRLRDARSCCRDVLHDWIHDNQSSYPVSWEGLICLLKDMKLTVLAKKIPGPPMEGPADAVSSPSATFSTSDPSEAELQEELIKAVIDGKKVISRITATINLAGLPSSGKTTLIDRMLNREIKDEIFSTGVSKPPIMVDINPSSITSNVGLETQSQSEIFEWKETDCKASFLSHFCGSEKPAVLRQTLPIQNSEANSSGCSASSTHDINLSNKIKGISGGIKSIKDLKTKGSLYIRDVGGQIEFQECLSLLICGPSIYLFVFNASIDINKKQIIKYRVKKDEVKEYQSSFSTKDALLQFLASVKALKNSVTKDNMKPQVFIVGTHMDELFNNIPASKINDQLKKINNQLKTIITDSKCKEFVQYKRLKKEEEEGEEEVMFAVDNTLIVDKRLKDLKDRISLILKKPVFKVPYPVRYIVFALNLPNIKDNVLTLQECKKIANQFYIEDKDVPHLLDFLHSKTGILQWFNVKHLRNWVFKEPQFLFNKVTRLITETFIDPKHDNQHEVVYFRKKGIFDKVLMDDIFSGDDNLTSEVFIEFLIYLRMVVRYYDDVAQEDKYFIPCILNHVESSHHKIKTDIPPLNITFECGYCPKGVFGVLATYFITPNLKHRMSDDVIFTVTFLEDDIYKDEIAFKALFGSDEHTVYLKMHPSHLEVTFVSCPVKFWRKCCRGTSLQIACNAIRLAMSRYIDKSLDHLNYNKSSVKPKANLKCPKRDCTLHEVLGGSELKFICQRKRVAQEIPSKAKYWFNEGAPHKEGEPPDPLSAPHMGNGTRHIQNPDNCCKRFTELNEWTVGIATGIMSFVAGVIIHKMPDSYNDKAIPLLVVGASSVVGLFITSVIMIICYCKKKCC